MKRVGSPEKILVFDISGHMAHFRKFYTNSSSLSYSFPPRTVLCGLVAGVLGRERDSYYEDFSMERCRIGISMRTPIRKITQTVNYVKTKDKYQVDGSKGGTQIPIEFVLPRVGTSRLIYRVYFWHTDEEILKELSRRVKEKRPIYPPYLGITECPAQIKWVGLIQSDDLILVRDPEEPLPISTVVPISRVRDNGFKLSPGVQILKERIPLELGPDRYLSCVDDLIYERECNPLNLTVNGDVFRISYLDSILGRKVEEYIVFMEPA